jgi:hypothetical protein
MKKYLFVFSVCLLLLACSVDYDMGQSNLLEQNRLVVNSLLNPHQPINVFFYKIERGDTGYCFSTVRDIKVILKENEKMLFDGICNDTVLRLDYHPKSGLYYTIEASFPGFERVSANTIIPDSITCKAEMIIDEPYNQSDRLVELSEFILPANSQASLWITSYAIFEDETYQYQEIYVNNLLIDEVNQISGMPVRNPVVGSLYHDAFLRIKNNNLSDLDKLVFTPAYISYNYYKPFDPENPEPFDPWYGQRKIGIKLITASREYDQYCRTLYLQKSMIIYDNDISAIVYQPVQVYSNLTNGVGIFAGLNETNYYFDLPNEEILLDSSIVWGANKPVRSTDR